MSHLRVPSVLIGGLAASMLAAALATAPQAAVGSPQGIALVDKKPVATHKGGLSDTALQRVVNRVLKGRPVAQRRAIVRGGDVRIEVIGTTGRAAAHAVRAEGGRVVGPRAGTMVLADVPATRVATLEARRDVSYVRLPISVDGPGSAYDVGPADDVKTGGANEKFGTLGLEPVQKTNVAAWQGKGFTGQGIKVGIIDHFNLTAWNASVPAELTAAPTTIFCRDRGVDCAADFWNSGTHGNAVAETILDMAPNATLVLATAETGTDFQAAVDFFKSQGVRIISRSETAQYDGPGNGTGNVANTVQNAVNSGMAWFQSAGNSAHAYFRTTGFLDANGDNFMDFPGTKYEANEVLEYDCAYLNGLRWSDWGTPRSDYDLYIYENPTDAAPKRVYAANQATGAPPLEIPDMNNYPCAQGTSDYVSIYREPGTASSDGDVIEFMTNGAAIEKGAPGYSATAPVVDVGIPGEITVGAIDPWNGTTIAGYSSQGPTNDGRMKPDLSAASNFTSKNGRNGRFNGTSAATPVVAGAAAVVLSSNPGLTPAQLTDYLKTAVVDRGTAGPDTVYGTGELVLPAPPGTAPPPPPPPAASAVSVTSAYVVPILRSLKENFPIQVRWAVNGTQSSATVWRSLNKNDFLQGAATGTKKRVRVKMVLGKSNQYAIRAADPAGALSDWYYTRIYHPRVIDDKDFKVKYGKGWRHGKLKAAWKHTYSTSAGSHSSARLRFKGSSVSLVMFRSPNSGRVKIYVDGKGIGKINLHSKRVQAKRVVANLYYRTRGRHVVEIEPLSNAPVFLDGFLVLG